jgi:hypothetical protein
MSFKPNTLFTAWDSTPYKTDLIKIQSIINYCASRFKAAALALARRPVETMEEAELLVGGLAAEVVCKSFDVVIF